MFHVISISIFWLYQVPLYLILLYQFPDIGYIGFRYIKVCHISFHFCHIRFCYIKFQFGYIRFVISDSVISKSVISKGPSPNKYNRVKIDRHSFATETVVKRIVRSGLVF